jgi:hypothetical protein
MASVTTVITKMRSRSQEYGLGAVASDMVMHPFRLVADCAALAMIRVSTSMLLAAVTVHIFAFLCRISDKPVAPYWEISDFYAGVEKGLIGVCPTYAAGGLME